LGDDLIALSASIKDMDDDDDDNDGSDGGAGRRICQSTARQ
jgi:hypothetical protein